MEVFLLVTAGWVFSVCLHEFGHTAVAYRGGDYTVKDKGYLTLNPLNYAHPVYSLLIPVVFVVLGGIGLPGGAVYINDHLLRSKGWRTGASLAGPAMNIALLLVLCIPFWVGALEHPRAASLAGALAFLIQLQVSAVIFNLLPIPPLDGFQALSPWMPRDLASRMMANSNVMLFVLFILMWNVPAANRAFWTVVLGVVGALNIDPSLAWQGWSEFQFWRN